MASPPPPPPAKLATLASVRCRSPPATLLAAAAAVSLLICAFDASFLASSGAAAVEKPHWLSAPPLPANFTASLLARWRAAGRPGAGRTTNISFPAALPRELPAGAVSEFTFTAFDSGGRRRRDGGDYFELDLAGESWKSRPPTVDHGDGSYSFRLQVDPRFAGDYNLSIILLFRSFEGLRFSTARFIYNVELLRAPIRFKATSPVVLPDLPACGPPDFRRDAWAGRWTRHGEKRECADDVDGEGRYRCLPADAPCEPPWCRGAVGALESSGWVFSAHCAFALFAAGDAWRCLRGRWLLFWGDSNHVDTIRNLLTFVLGVNATAAAAVSRRFDGEFANPADPAATVRITNVFNGHWNASKNYLGLDSLKNAEHRELLRRYFSPESRRVPDAVFLNSGLHDGVYYYSLGRFVRAADRAAQFWAELLEDVSPRPRVFFRTTVAAGGYAREMAFNPSKMEAYNGVLVEKLRERGVLAGGGGVIDSFDMTFPWHYDNRCSDGVHYGRAPARAVWRDGKIGHQYFVDLMLCHVILNALCSG